MTESEKAMEAFVAAAAEMKSAFKGLRYAMEEFTWEMSKHEQRSKGT